MTDINTGTETNNAIPIAILVRGIALGIGVAFVFALVISVVPEMSGALAFDGLAIGFIPDLYGQDERSIGWFQPS